jgi:hypothetical protein
MNNVNGPTLENDGFEVIDRSIFWPSETSMNAAKKRVLSLAQSYELKFDQPGCVRRYLDDKRFLSVVSGWLLNPIFENMMTSYFRSNELAINFIRYREPKAQAGLQSWHIDWKENHRRQRIEVFIALDDTHEANGCTQIKFSAGDSIYYAAMSAGSVLVMDSTIEHRGGLNKSGRPRRLLDIQIALYETLPNDQYVAKYPFKPPPSTHFHFVE